MVGEGRSLRGEGRYTHRGERGVVGFKMLSTYLRPSSPPTVGTVVLRVLAADNSSHTPLDKYI